LAPILPNWPLTSQKSIASTPRLMEEGIHVDEPQAARVDVSGDWDRAIGDRSQPFYISGTTFTYHIPFEGDEELLFLQPSSMTTIWPEGRVRKPGDRVGIHERKAAGLTDSAFPAQRRAH
jgi:hypothetical protein